MGVVIDTGVFIRWEREGGIIEFSRWSSLGEPCISVITESELKVGIHRANTRERRERRSLFVQTVLSNVVVLPIDSRVTDNQCCGIPSRAKFASHSVPKRYFQIGPPDSRWSDLS
jgi:predicted nucleic acid-binding protein